MIFYCPKCQNARKVVYQPSKRVYWCQQCNSTFTLREVSVVGAWKPAEKMRGPGT